ncbi:MAG: amidohydrolase [Oscillospiraceae bacterium]
MLADNKAMNSIEKSIFDIIDANADKIIAFGKSIRPEEGFHEADTSCKIASELENLGLPVERGLAVTGVRATLGKAAPCVAILAELDGIYCPNHSSADKATGISHACAHSAQLAAMLGSAIALTSIYNTNELCGSIAFFAVPAEEYLSEKTRIYAKSLGVQFMSGKSELIRIGEFDNIDIAIASHAHMVKSDADILLGLNASCGYTTRHVIIHGKSAHAAAAPWDGINALSAATLALSAIGLLRETFNEKDCVRIHTNILNGGNAVNVVPDTVVIEAMIRAKNLDAINAAADKFDNAMRHCALAIGAKAQIEKLCGYMPVPEYMPNEATLSAAKCLSGNIKTIDSATINFASTDLGDLSAIMPILTCTHGGISGALHSAEFTITDDYKAYVAPAKLMALEAYHLLRNDAKLAHKVIQNYNAPMNKAQYINTVEANGDG